MRRVITHEPHQAFSNAAQALESIFGWRGVLRAFQFIFFSVLCWRFCPITTDSAILGRLGEIANKKRNKVELGPGNK
jgi:hypothetical protein